MVSSLLYVFPSMPLFMCLSGSEMVEAQCQRFEVRSADGERVLFSADEEEITIGTEKLRVTGRPKLGMYSYGLSKKNLKKSKWSKVHIMLICNKMCFWRVFMF